MGFLESHGSGPVPVLSLISCVTMGELLKFSKPGILELIRSVGCK